MKWANMVEMAVGLGAVSSPLKGAVINIFTMPYAAHCPSVLTPYTHTQSLMNKATHHSAQTLEQARIQCKSHHKHPSTLLMNFDLTKKM